MMDEILTVAEVAPRLKLSPSMVRKQVRLGLIPFFRVGSAIRFRASELDEWTKAITYRPGKTKGDRK